MGREGALIDVVIETGKTKTFAAAHDWPGWCRSGPDEASALRSLLAYTPRYQKALSTGQISFAPPLDLSGFNVIERISGNASTDFGVPGMPWLDDNQPVAETEGHFFQEVLRACWLEFDKAVQLAEGRSLRKGPRGGGRDVLKIKEHVYEVDEVYLKSLGGSFRLEENRETGLAQANQREQILATLKMATRGEISERGPRGGLRWTPRYFVRRLAWHELDHAWEIMERLE